MAGCATTEYQPLPQVPHRAKTPAVTTPVVEKKQEGVYHKVAKGQTIWRIAQAYGVSVDDIIQSNHIPNVAAIEVNQLLFIPGAKTVQTIAAQPTPNENSREFAWPVKGKVISYFGDRHGEGSNHGVDIEAAEGDPVRASRSGTVVLADYMPGYGQTLIIDHGDGFYTVYAQNRKLLLKAGDQANKGDAVAEVGKVGSRSFEHFEVRKGEKAINPLYYLP